MPLGIRGESHVWTSDTIKDLQHAVRGNFPENILNLMLR